MVITSYPGGCIFQPSMVENDEQRFVDDYAFFDIVHNVQTYENFKPLLALIGQYPFWLCDAHQKWVVTMWIILWNYYYINKVKFLQNLMWNKLISFLEFKKKNPKLHILKWIN